MHLSRSVKRVTRPLGVRDFFITEQVTKDEHQASLIQLIKTCRYCACESPPATL